MACTDCFDDCEGSLTSDRCIKYTGDDYTDLSICDGDSEQSVTKVILDQLIALRQGNNINITGITGCNSVLSLLDSTTTPSLVSLIQALYTSYCSLKSNVVTLQSSNNNTYSFDIQCLTGLTATSSVNDIIQAIIISLCATNTSVTTILGDYVKASQLNTLIASYISSSSNSTVVNNYSLAIPYVAYEYYGPLTNFDATGKGLAVKGFDKMYICNGLNGTPDKRGRVAVGAIAGVPGSTLDAAVDPSLPANTGKNYALRDKFGNSSVILSAAQIPAHTHPVIDPGHKHTLLPDAGSAQVHRSGDSGSALRIENYSVSATTTTNQTGIAVGSAGGSQPHDIVQPSIGANFIIYLP